jgi:phosphoglycolate phosphatase-like HAD superfamily hydrolase
VEAKEQQDNLGAALLSAAGTEAVPAVEVIHPARLKDFQPQAFLFDFDRTLWNGFPRHFEAVQVAAWLGGQPQPTEKLIARVEAFLDDTDGMSWDERLAAWPTDLPKSPGGYPVEVRRSIHQHVADQKLTQPKYLMRGAFQLLQAVQQAKLPIGIITGGTADTRRRYAQDLGIGEFFGDQVYRDGNKTLTIRQAAEAWGIPTAEVVGVGDGVPDIKALLANGAVAVGLAYSPEHRQKLIDAGAHVVIYRDFNALSDILQALRLARPSNAGVEETGSVLSRQEVFTLISGRIARRQTDVLVLEDPTGQVTTMTRDSREFPLPTTEIRLKSALASMGGDPGRIRISDNGSTTTLAFVPAAGLEEDWQVQPAPTNLFPLPAVEGAQAEVDRLAIAAAAPTTGNPLIPLRSITNRILQNARGVTALIPSETALFDEIRRLADGNSSSNIGRHALMYGLIN